MKVSATNPSSYLESIESRFREDLIALDKEISRIMKGQSRVLWQGVFWGGTEQHIIGYGDMMYTSSSGKNTEWFKIGLSQQKNYISLYVNAVDGRQYLTEKYKDKLGKVKVGKSSVSFKGLGDIDLNMLKEFLSKAAVLMNKQ